MSQQPCIPGVFDVRIETITPVEARFDGSVYDSARDNVRLTGQLQRVYAVLVRGGWWTLDAIAVCTGDPHASISAQIRHLRKPRFGAHRIDKRLREGSTGSWEYRLGKGE